MNPKTVFPASAIVAALLCASCGDDPAMVEKKNQQAAEIARLKGEIALVEEKLKNLPPDVSEQLEIARKEVTRQEAEIERLEAEVREQQERKTKLQKEFDAYRIKYRVP